MGAKVKFENNFPHLEEELKALSNLKLIIGPATGMSGGKDADEKDKELPRYAAANEYGAPSRNIPERSYIRSALRKKETRDKVLKNLSGALNRLIAGNMNAAGVMDAIGGVLASCIKEQIGSNIGPPNKPSTIARKGSDKGTLLDTEHLLKSISYEVIE